MTKIVEVAVEWLLYYPIVGLSVLALAHILAAISGAIPRWALYFLCGAIGACVVYLQGAAS